MSTVKILVWDVPTRVFHWLLAVSFAGAYLTAESESWRLVHVTLGYSFGGLLLFRLLWGVAGTRYARFASFLFRPQQVLDYLRSLLGRNRQHYTGHNPAGSWAIFAMLLLGVGVAVSGYLQYAGIGGDVFEEVHEVFANLMLILVIVHIAGVALSSLLHRENLPRSMVTGYKTGEPGEAISGPRRVIGVLLAAAVLAFWMNAFGLRDTLVGTPVDVAAATADNGPHGDGHEEDDD